MPRSLLAPIPTWPRPPTPWAVSTAASSSPCKANVTAYDELYAEYRGLHDHFGRGGSDVMLRLKAIRRRALRQEGAP